MCFVFLLFKKGHNYVVTLFLSYMWGMWKRKLAFKMYSSQEQEKLQLDLSRSCISWSLNLMPWFWGSWMWRIYFVSEKGIKFMKKTVACQRLLLQAFRNVHFISATVSVLPYLLTLGSAWFALTSKMLADVSCDEKSFLWEGNCCPFLLDPWICGAT